MNAATLWDVGLLLGALLDDPGTYDGKIEDLVLIKLNSGPMYIGDYRGHTATHLSIKPCGTDDIVAFERIKIKSVEMYDNYTGYMMEIDLD